jgi:hypothetical protein
MKRIALLALLFTGCIDHQVPIGSNGLPDGPLATDGGLDLARSIDAAEPDAAQPTDQRYLFLVETSYAMSVLDKVSARAQSVAAVLNKYAGNPMVYFSVVPFDSITDPIPFTGFTTTPDIVSIVNRLSMADKMCDDEGGLDRATSLIDTDAKNLPPQDRPNVHYTVVLISGSLPGPECNSAPIACGGSSCIAGNECRIGACVPEQMVCTTDRAQWINLDQPQAQSYFPSLQQGMDYNTASRITAKVKALTALAAQDGIGAVQLDTVLNFDPNAASDPNFAAQMADRTASQNFLQSLALAGGGHFIDLSKAPLPY